MNRIGDIMKDKLIIKGARENNLKNVDLIIPKNQLVIMTGVSGSGKTSLAFDTIYAEGQRRYVESLSAYARQFLGNMEKPDVDSIEGLSPAISIDQKTTSNNPRSTVGTVTEIYDYFRLLYARIGVPFCPIHGEKIEAQSIATMTQKVMDLPENTKIQILSPVINDKKGSHKDVIEKLIKDGYLRAIIDNELFLLEEAPNLDKNKRHTIMAVIDRIIVKDSSRSRIYDSLESATKLSSGYAVIEFNGNYLNFSEHFACKQPGCGFTVPKLEPRLFSYNTPIGACSDCNGLGVRQEIDLDLLIPDKSLSINEGGIKYFKNTVLSDSVDWQKFEILCDYFNIDRDKPISKLSKSEMKHILIGTSVPVEYKLTTRSGKKYEMKTVLEGIQTLIERRYRETSSQAMRDWYQGYMSDQTCPTCNGRRLSAQVLAVMIGGLNISEVTDLSIIKALEFFSNLELSENEKKIASLALKEIVNRLSFLKNVGLEYLTLSRMAATLSGGEAQRIRLATQIGSKLTGVLYVLDEPSIGLHQRDNQRLIDTLHEMRDLGNTLIVVEHDEDTMLASDYIVDIGPRAGEHGGQVIAQGTPTEIMNNPNSVTGDYLAKRKKIEIPKTRRKGNGLFIEIKKANENNLKNINVKFPLQTLTAVTGVSGGGKSTLVNEILYKGLANELYKVKRKVGSHKEIIGLENVDKVVDVSQDPIGRTPRSNPATYTGVFDEIRDLYASLPESKLRGYEKGRFSFNVKGGRCETCQGDGVIKISMHFLPDVYVVCDACHGKRYNEETLQVKYQDINIYDVLEMTVDNALSFFEKFPKISRKLQTLHDVGLGYIKLGQNGVTLSGGEAQRVKLATELQKRATGKTVYILDEPTTGLHTADVAVLVKVLQKIVDQGDTVIVIEHNLDVIKLADYIIDLGPEGGDGGGQIVASGTPEKVCQVEGSYTGYYLNKVLNSK